MKKIQIINNHSKRDDRVPSLHKAMFGWFHGSSFKGFSILFPDFPVFWLAKLESSQKSNRTWLFGHFSRHIYSAVIEAIRVTNYPTSYDAKKCYENLKSVSKVFLPRL